MGQTGADVCSTAETRRYFQFRNRRIVHLFTEISASQLNVAAKELPPSRQSRSREGYCFVIAAREHQDLALIPVHNRRQGIDLLRHTDLIQRLFKATHPHQGERISLVTRGKGGVKLNAAFEGVFSRQPVPLMIKRCHSKQNVSFRQIRIESEGFGGSLNHFWIRLVAWRKIVGYKERIRLGQSRVSRRV